MTDIGTAFVHPGGYGDQQRYTGQSFDYPPAHPRCILPGNQVVVPGFIEAAAKSFYDGPCIEISTANGRRLTVTKNHPILTLHGWIEAGTLRKGDNVIATAFAERIAARVNPNYNHVPTMIEEVVKTFFVSSTMSPISMPSTAKAFHGDGQFIYGNIDIVTGDGFLMGDGAARITEPLSQQLFGIGNARGPLASDSLPLHYVRGMDGSPSFFVGGSHLFGSYIERHSLPFSGFGLGLSANFHTGALEGSGESRPLDSCFVTQAVDGFPSQISNDKGIKLGDGFSEISFPVFSDSKTFETSSDGVTGNAPLARKFTDRFASLIAPDEIVNVREFYFSGHVYDLQVSDYQLYITGGILTSNCRCWVAPVVGG